MRPPLKQPYALAISRVTVHRAGCLPPSDYQFLYPMPYGPVERSLDAGSCVSADDGDSLSGLIFAGINLSEKIKPPFLPPTLLASSFFPLPTMGLGESISKKINFMGLTLPPIVRTYRRPSPFRPGWRPQTMKLTILIWTRS
jgi:hypothetical protein